MSSEFSEHCRGKGETKMKMMMVAVCAMVAAFAAVADDAPPQPRFLGFALGDKVDAAVCKAHGFSEPEKVVVDKQCTTYYCCKRAAPTVICSSWFVGGVESQSPTGKMPVGPVSAKCCNL